MHRSNTLWKPVAGFSDTGLFAGGDVFPGQAHLRIGAGLDLHEAEDALIPVSYTHLDAPLGQLHVEIRRLQKAQQYILYVVTHIAGLGQCMSSQVSGSAFPEVSGGGTWTCFPVFLFLRILF